MSAPRSHRACRRADRQQGGARRPESGSTASFSVLKTARSRRPYVGLRTADALKRWAEAASALPVLVERRPPGAVCGTCRPPRDLTGRQENRFLANRCGEEGRELTLDPPQQAGASGRSPRQFAHRHPRPFRGRPPPPPRPVAKCPRRHDSRAGATRQASVSQVSDPQLSA